MYYIVFSALFIVLFTHPSPSLGWGFFHIQLLVLVFKKSIKIKKTFQPKKIKNVQLIASYTLTIESFDNYFFDFDNITLL